MIKIRFLSKAFLVVVFATFFSVFEDLHSSGIIEDKDEEKISNVKSNIDEINKRLFVLEEKVSLLAPFSDLISITHPNQVCFMHEVRRPITSFFASELISASGRFEEKKEHSNFMLAVALTDTASFFCPLEAQIIISAATTAAKIAHAGYKFVTDKEEEYYSFSSFSEIDRISHAVAFSLSKMHEQVLQNIASSEDARYLGTVVGQTIQHYLDGLTGDASKIRIVTPEELIFLAFNKVYKERKSILPTVRGVPAYCVEIEMMNGNKFYDIELLLGSNLKVRNSDGEILYRNNCDKPYFEWIEKLSKRPKVNYVGVQNTGFTSVIEKSLFDRMKARGFRGKYLEATEDLIPETPQNIDSINASVISGGSDKVTFNDEVFS